MNAEELEYFLKHSEPHNSPPLRIRLWTDEEKSAVILLSAAGSHLGEFLVDAFRTKTLELVEEDVLGLDLPTEPEIKETRPLKSQAWRVQVEGQQLVIPMKRNAVKKGGWCTIGSVIIGKDCLIGTPTTPNRITKAELLPKNTPTPFVADEWGDSYNDSYYLEPRIVDTIPSTVFHVVREIMAIAKTAFQKGDFEVASVKYRKAFHYCHSYYPDDLEEEDLNTATQLKLQSLLNLALAAIKVGTPAKLTQAIESVDFVLGMPEATETDKAKAFYRKGQATLLLGDDKSALADFQQSLNFKEDPMTKKALEQCELARTKRLNSLHEKMRKAFN